MTMAGPLITTRLGLIKVVGCVTENEERAIGIRQTPLR